MSTANVGIVLASRSRALAEAALDLARQLIVAVDVLVEPAAGLTDGGLSTNPGTVVEAVERPAERCEGVLVLADLGSGIMSVEMALEMLDPVLAERARLSVAPFVKGLLGTYGATGVGKGLQTVAAKVDGAAEAKRSQVTTFWCASDEARRVSRSLWRDPSGRLARDRRTVPGGWHPRQ